MEPPIQTEYFRSGGAMILTFMDDGARAVISFCIRSEIPGYMVVPPDCAIVSTLILYHFANLRTYHDNVTIEILTDINIALHDGVEGSDVDTAALKTQDRWLEKRFRCTETFVTNGNDLSVRKFIRLLQAGRLAGSLDFLFEVEGNVAELLLDITNDFSLSSSGESVTALSQDLHEVISQITTSHIDTGNGVRKRETFVDGDNVSNSVTRVQHDTSSTTGSIQGENGLDRNVECGGVEGLENDLGHLLSVGLGVDWGFGEQDWMFLRCNTELIVEGVMPDLLHIVPVGNNTVLNWVSQSENTTLGLCFITNIGILLTHTDHDTTFLISSILFECHELWRVGWFLTHGDEDDQQWKLNELLATMLVEINALRPGLTDESATQVDLEG